MAVPYKPTPQPLLALFVIRFARAINKRALIDGNPVNQQMI